MFHRFILLSAENATGQQQKTHRSMYSIIFDEQHTINATFGQVDDGRWCSETERRRKGV